MGCGSSSMSRFMSISDFNVLKVLGEGASCVVKAVEHQKTGQRYALKVLTKTSANELLFKQETKILGLLDHDNILKLEACWQDSAGFYILTRLCTGGELFDKVAEHKNGFSEKDASHIIHMMLTSLKYCHERRVVHRDLKPENFVFESASPSSQLQLIDFGVATVSRKDTDSIADVCGSPYYVAPEVLDTKCKRTCASWKASDMWSMGVIIFLLVTGKPPFFAKTTKEIFSKIKQGTFRFPRTPDNKIIISPDCQDLIKRLLRADFRLRLTAAEALAHPWLHGAAPPGPLPMNVLEDIATFQRTSRAKKAVARVMRGCMTDADTARLQSVFRQYDKNGDGVLGAEEITVMMKGMGMDASEAIHVMTELDTDGDNYINYDEFASAYSERQLSKTKEAERAFRKFDLNRNGFITIDEIEKVASFLSRVEVARLMADVDADGDGKITFDEWLHAMQGLNQSIDFPEEQDTASGKGFTVSPSAASRRIGSQPQQRSNYSTKPVDPNFLSRSVYAVSASTSANSSRTQSRKVTPGYQ